LRRIKQFRNFQLACLPDSCLSQSCTKFHKYSPHLLYNLYKKIIYRIFALDKHLKRCIMIDTPYKVLLKSERRYSYVLSSLYEKNPPHGNDLSLLCTADPFPHGGNGNTPHQLPHASPALDDDRAAPQLFQRL
jgi:hypothetical protein